MAMSTHAEDPAAHVELAEKRLSELIDQLRRSIEVVEEPQAKALFETAAETLGGLRQAFEDYEQGDEEAWEEQ